jgi:hypothetical protein
LIAGAVALGFGAVAAGVDCSEDLKSTQCLLDTLSLGLGGEGFAADQMGAKFVSRVLSGQSIGFGGEALFLPSKAC